MSAIQLGDRIDGFFTMACAIYMLLLVNGILPRKPKNPEKMQQWRKRLRQSAQSHKCPINNF
jgi:hypothetical protein